MQKAVLLVKTVFFVASVFSLLFQGVLLSLEVPVESFKEEVVSTEHQLMLHGRQISYRATAGLSPMKEEQGKTKGMLFYVAYHRTDGEEGSRRPVVFCFNGGPGSSSVWLHMGVLGPQRLAIEDREFNPPPYRFFPNEHTLLDVADLVFIDPISTGYSRSVPGEDAKDFHGVEADVKWLSEWVRFYITRHDLWDAPKFLIGESYGTLRAVEMAAYLHEEVGCYLNGVALLSSILDFQTLMMGRGESSNDTPYPLYLPTYTAAAWYHKKLAPKLQENLFQALKDAEAFALNEYVAALFKGDLLKPEEKKRVVEKVAYFTGLSPEFVDNFNCRVDLFHFSKELLRTEGKILGRFDARFLGMSRDKNSEYAEYDPSFNGILGDFTATFNAYVRRELKWEKDEHYRILANVRPWSYGKANNKYYDATPALRDVLVANPDLKIFVANSYFDLATPYFATEYTFNHLNLDRKVKERISMEYYRAGHMMYLDEESLQKLSQDLHRFIGAAQAK